MTVAFKLATQRLGELEPNQPLPLGVPSSEYVGAIRRLERNVETLCSAMHFQQKAMQHIMRLLTDEQRKSVDELLAAQTKGWPELLPGRPVLTGVPKPTIANPEILRHSKVPCEGCGNHWSEMKRAMGRMFVRCPECR